MKIGFFILFFWAHQSFGQTVDELTESLTNGINDDSIKLVNIYKWVTKNVLYDHHFLRNRIEGDTTLLQEPYNVVVRKKAICIGYAKLIRAMCRQAGIEAVIVDGLTKTINNEIDHEEHAWNAVKIHGNWYLVDATWDAGFSAPVQKYFLSTPSVFSENHYPHDPIWQLSEQPKDFECFRQEKYCNTNKNALFNFKDSISVWEKKDTLDRLVDAGERSLRFHPTDLEAIRNLANAHSGYAMNGYREYAKIRADVIARRNVVERQADVIRLLDTIQYHLAEARLNYERLITFARNGVYTDAHMNRDLMEENMMKLDKERDFVFQYIKK